MAGQAACAGMAKSRAGSYSLHPMRHAATTRHGVLPSQWLPAHCSCASSFQPFFQPETQARTTQRAGRPPSRPSHYLCEPFIACMHYHCHLDARTCSPRLAAPLPSVPTCSFPCHCLALFFPVHSFLCGGLRRRTTCMTCPCRCHLLYDPHPNPATCMPRHLPCMYMSSHTLCCKHPTLGTAMQSAI